MSPATMLYGRVIKDHLPVLHDRYSVRKEWKEIGELREGAMARRHMRNEQFYNRHCRPLRELQIGDFVQIQNQEGSCPRRWMKTGRVVETCGNRQYRVRMDGSNRVTARNRRFLRKIYPVVDGPYHRSPQTAHTPVCTETPLKKTYEEAMEVDEQVDTTTSEEETMDTEDSLVVEKYEAVPNPETTPIRRQPSQRTTRPPRNLSPRMYGKSHEVSETY